MKKWRKKTFLEVVFKSSYTVFLLNQRELCLFYTIMVFSLRWLLSRVKHIRCDNVSGVILSPGTTLLRSSDIRYRLNVSRAKCIITNAECAEHVDEVSVKLLNFYKMPTV